MVFIEQYQQNERCWHLLWWSGLLRPQVIQRFFLLCGSREENLAPGRSFNACRRRGTRRLYITPQAPDAQRLCRKDLYLHISERGLLDFYAAWDLVRGNMMLAPVKKCLLGQAPSRFQADVALDDLTPVPLMPFTSSSHGSDIRMVSQKSLDLLGICVLNL